VTFAPTHSEKRGPSPKYMYYEKHKNKNEWKTINNIKQKMRTNELVVTKADKGKTIILTKEE
jgi:hypothetical protein